MIGYLQNGLNIAINLSLLNKYLLNYITSTGKSYSTDLHGDALCNICLGTNEGNAFLCDF